MESLLKGRDVFGVLPTGFRKSLMFQLFVLVKNRASNSPNASVERPTIIVICRLKSIMEEQITSNEFGFSAAELRFDGETLNSIRNGEVQVVYATADEQVLKEQFTTLLKEDCPFRRAICRTSLLRNSSHYILNTIFYNCEALTGFLLILFLIAEHLKFSFRC